MADPGNTGGGTGLGPFDGASGAYAEQQNQLALKAIAALLADKPYLQQIDAYNWVDPGTNIVWRLSKKSDGTPQVTRQTITESKAYLASIGYDTSAPSGGSSGGGGGSSGGGSGGGSAAAPRSSPYQRVMIGGKPYVFNPNTGEYTAADIGGTTSGGGQYFGFNSPEEAQAYAASIAGASPEQLAALQGIAASTSSGSASNADYANLAYKQQQSDRQFAQDSALQQAQLDLAYAKMTADERLQARQLEQQARNDGLDANSARMQALASVMANKNNNATNLAQTSGQIAAQAAQFASNPRDAVADIAYRNAIGGATPYGGTDNAAFPDLQTALLKKFQELFGGVGADLNAARTQRDQPIPAEFSQPISVPQVGFNPTTYKAPQINVPKVAPPAASVPPAASSLPAGGDPWAAFRGKSAAEIAQFNAAYNKAPAPAPAAPADPWAAFRNMTPEQLAAFNAAYNPQSYAKGGVVTVGKRSAPVEMPYHALPVGLTPPIGGGSLIPRIVIPDTIDGTPYHGVPDRNAPAAAPISTMLPGALAPKPVPMPAGVPWQYGGVEKPLDKSGSFSTPWGFAKGGTLNFDHLFDGRSQPGMSPSSSEGGTNLNIHERAVIVGESGQVYGTLGEKRPDGTVRAEQLIIKPLKSEVAKDKKLEDQGKSAVEMQKATLSHFDQGGTATSMPDDFYAGLRKLLGGIDPQAQAAPGQRLIDPRLLGAGIYNRAYGNNPDQDLRGYIESAYSSAGISPDTLAYTLRAGRPTGGYAGAVRYA